MSPSSSKCQKEILDLDVYELLQITVNADNTEIKKAFRKKALSCHPDKNPDNPTAAAEFDTLKKILEVLLDPGTRAAYDKVLRGRKLAAVRASEASARSQKLRRDLERREREAALAKDKLSDKERFARELQRLEKEGEALIAEEIARIEKEAKEERLRANTRLHTASPAAPSVEEGSHRVKVRWVTPEGGVPYTKDQIYTLFYKWGDINAVVIRQKSQKGSALVDYKTKAGADMALQYEKGLPECPVVVTALRSSSPEGAKPESRGEAPPKSSRDYERIADMEKRRKNERAALIAEIIRNDGVVS